VRGGGTAGDLFAEGEVVHVVSDGNARGQSDVQEGIVDEEHGGARCLIDLSIEADRDCS
jgi:hypothetical protein